MVNFYIWHIDVTLKITNVVFSLASSDLWYGHIALNDPEFDLIFILARAKTTESSEFERAVSRYLFFFEKTTFQ